MKLSTKPVESKKKIWEINREFFKSPDSSPNRPIVAVVPPIKRTKNNEVLKLAKTTPIVIRQFSDEVKQIQKIEKITQKFVIDNSLEADFNDKVCSSPIEKQSEIKIAQVEPIKITSEQPLDLTVKRKRSLPVSIKTIEKVINNEFSVQNEVGQLLTFQLTKFCLM